MVELIQKAGFEIIRDVLAANIATSILAQKNQAIAEGKDPDDYDLAVYAERVSPWEQWLNSDPSLTYPPICNIWYNSTSFDKSKSNMVKRQLSDSRYYIDVYGYGVSSPGGSGVASGEYKAAEKCHQGIRLVTASVMSADNSRLGLSGRVWDRWISSVDIFQPEFDGRFVQKILAARIVCEVAFNEFTPQTSEVILEYLSANISRASDGRFLIGADFDYTT